jgi:hypothetical protein
MSFQFGLEMIDRSECYRLDRKLLCASFYFIEGLIEKLSDMPDDYRNFGFEIQISQQPILQNLECMPPCVIWSSNWQTNMARKKSMWNLNLYTRGAQVPGSRSPPRLNFLVCRLIFVTPRYGTCVMSLFWPPEFWSGSKVLKDMCRAASDRQTLFKNFDFYTMRPFAICIMNKQIHTWLTVYYTVPYLSLLHVSTHFENDFWMY